jgi:peptide deformylase
MIINIKGAYSDKVLLKSLVLAPRIKPTTPVKHIDDTLLQEVKMALKGCLAYDGIGIAANQLGINKSFFLIREKEDEETFKVYFNPKVVKASKVLLTQKEACLSVPRYQLLVSRADEILASWDEIVDGCFVRVEKTLKGSDARVFLHEYDHLQGISIIDRSCELNRAERRKIVQELSQR